MIEAAAVIGLDEQPLYWHTPGDCSVVSIPDDRNLWDILWQYRDLIAGVAHSHPGSGIPGPSHTDLTTFAAIEAAIGKSWKWWIISATDIIVISKVDGEWHNTHKLSPPIWVDHLRQVSGYQV